MLDGNLEALKAYEREQARMEAEWAAMPVVGYCFQCGEPIKGSTDRWDGDEYVETDEGLVHWDCWTEYGETLKKQG